MNDKERRFYESMMSERLAVAWEAVEALYRPLKALSEAKGGDVWENNVEKYLALERALSTVGELAKKTYDKRG